MKILYNARVYTLDSSHPVASAIVMERERVMAVGETDDLLSEFDWAEKQDIINVNPLKKLLTYFK